MQMNFKWYLCNFERFITFTLVIVISFFTMFTFTAYSDENSYQLIKVSQLEHRLISQPKWQQFIANPSNKKQHFVIRESGQIYLIDDDEINPEAILDMGISQQTGSSSLFKLTAIELHPNFSLRDEVGYRTFYTAHIENINKKSQTKRMQERVENIQLSYDSVITEWKFSAVNHQKVDVNSKREVLRIGVPDNSMVIKQMSFNPYIKSWNDGFGLLYIALNGDDKWSQPLYSGVILRINPTKLGLRSFSVPDNNPYLKNSQINDAIYLLGGQGIEQFIWPGKNSEHLLVSHQYNKKYQLTLTGVRDDWRDSAAKNVLYAGEDVIYGVLMYQGRQLPLLRSKLLLLRKKEQYWFIDSLAFNTSDNKKNIDGTKSQLVWQFTSQQLPIHSQVILSTNHHDEVFFLEKKTSVLFSLIHQALVTKSAIEVNVESNTTENKIFDYSIFILLLILALLGIIYYWFKRNSYSVKKVVRKQFASLELSGSGQEVELYHRHEQHTDTIISIADIVSSEIKLNKQSISVINGQLGHGFKNDIDQNLRAIFAHEKIDKMVEGKVRQISLLLTDTQKNSYKVCLYMRKGSNRITKKSYVKVVDELIDWCWLIGGEINPDDTEKREVKSVALPKQKTEIKPDKNEVQLHNQITNIKPVVPKVVNTNEPLTDGTSLVLDNVNKDKDSAELEGAESGEVNNQVEQNHTIDTELVNALEKLVNLKQQGFLTMDEFTKAKENLLKGLLEK